MADDRAERLALELAEERERSRRLEQALAQFQREEDQSLMDQASRHRQQLVDQANVHRMMMARQADKYLEAAMRLANRHREAVTQLIIQRREAMDRLISGYRVQGSMRLNQPSRADAPPKKKRGRPRKIIDPLGQQAPAATVDATSSAWTDEPVPPKKRGRPPKQKQPELPRPLAEQKAPVPTPDATGRQSEGLDSPESEYNQSYNQWHQDKETSASADALPQQYPPRFSSNPSSFSGVNDRVAAAPAMRETHNRRVDGMMGKHTVAEGRPKLKTRRTSEQRVYIPDVCSSSDSSSDGLGSRKQSSTSVERFEYDEDED